MEKVMPGILSLFNEDRRSELRALTLSEGVGDTIIKQLGGGGKLRAMLGKKTKFLTYPDGVGFRFANRKRSKGNYVKIILRPDDTYDMHFKSLTATSAKDVKLYSGVYADQLISIFEKQTGLRLKLF